ncbi:DUF6057 family protein [uncultured Bacteroides sp.]|uniref:DUF6057 family protein n=1 Tax=uncultured Bacteroides sp. TaxID=162156 RepID=UPI0026323095|nr:DUF6057 family protein [uncultured Bacteroides sp.]
MRALSKKYGCWIVAGIGFIILFLYFYCALPYHLYHREQTQLFICSWNTVAGYMHASGGLSAFLGDFLTQFFYYQGMGPFILSILLLLLGVVVYRLLVPYLKGWTWVAVILVVCWETGRESGLNYPLSGTIALVGLGTTLCICRNLYKCFTRLDRLYALMMLVAGFVLFGAGEWKLRYCLPDFGREKLLRMDCETYFGRHNEMEQYFQEEDFRTSFATYYYNLANARRGVLPERLMTYYQPATLGLFLPVDSSSNYMKIYAANEVWFALGDMTMAEHAAILGMIFSPRHVGTRALKRLAEINLVNGDDQAALKYLRILKKTICHHSWAEKRMPGKESENVRKWLELKREMLPQNDTLRYAADAQLSLRHLLESNRENRMALDYLLCFDLLEKNISAFVDDYRRYAADRPPTGVYAEALLIYLASIEASSDEVKRWKIPASKVRDFNEYTEIYRMNQGNGTMLQPKFGKTYWFYFHFAVMKKQ